MYKFKLFCIFKENSATFTLKIISSILQLSTSTTTYRKKKIKGIIFEGLPSNFGEGNAANSSILAWRIPGTEEPAIYGVARSWTRLKQLKSNSFQLSKNHVGW